MPANLTADYRKAEESFRKAREPKERLDCLKEMLRTIPKHKGTDHLQADIKSRIKELTEELSAPKKGGRRKGPSHAIRREGAAQVALLGPPNAGKSSLHARLTGSKTDIGPYPLTTRMPVPGMLPYEDVHLQLVDLPPVSADFMESWIVNALQPADAALIVIDPSDPACVEQVDIVIGRLGERRITLTERWPGLGEAPAAEPAARADEEFAGDPFRIELPAALVVNKTDLTGGTEEVAALTELLDHAFPVLACSATTGDGCDAIGDFLFHNLRVVRVYTKTPGKPFKKDRPFTVRHGDTIADVATLVHKDIASSLRYARVWGENVFDGQQVGPDHAVSDGDIVELHMR